jgi:hypothetical protein
MHMLLLFASNCADVLKNFPPVLESGELGLSWVKNYDVLYLLPP